MHQSTIPGRRASLACAIVLPFLSLLLATTGADTGTGELPRKGFFGAQLRARTADERANQATDPGAGVVIEKILPDSTASAADFRRGDLLIALNGKPISEPSQFVETLSRIRSGETLTVSLVRDGQATAKKALLVPRPLERSDAYRVVYGSVPSLGKRLRTIVTQPKEGAKHPALFLIQGLGSFSIENSPGKTGAYARIIDDLSRRGFVTMRVDKPGQGDSEGGPTRDMDFETELDGYRQALKALKEFTFVDPEKVIILGHSMGGVMGPLLAVEIPVKGIAVYGTVAKTWHEYTLENVRRQMALGGEGFAAIDRALRQDAAIDFYVTAGLTPSEIAVRHPELKERVGAWYAEGKYHAATDYTYFRQLASKNLAEAWEKFGGYALAAWGKSDFISGADDHALIANIVNRAHPGRGVFLALDGIDHGFSRATSQEQSFKEFGKPDREFNPVFLDALRDWALKVCG